MVASERDRAIDALAEGAGKRRLEPGTERTAGLQPDANRRIPGAQSLHRSRSIGHPQLHGHSVRREFHGVVEERLVQDGAPLPGQLGLEARLDVARLGQAAEDEEPRPRSIDAQGGGVATVASGGWLTSITPPSAPGRR